MSQNKFSIQDLRLFQFFAIGANLIVLFYPIAVQTGWLVTTCPFIGNETNPCPSCGLTTGWMHLYDGHFSEAVQVNRHSLPLLLLVVLQLLWRILFSFKLPQIKHPLRIDVMVSGCLIVLLAGPYCLDLIRWLADSPMLLK